MSRLTKELTTNSNYEIQLIQKGFTYVANTPYYEQIIFKLGQLEDLEDKLGCSLEVVFKALKEGIIVPKDQFDLDEENEREYAFSNYIHSNMIIEEEIGLYYFSASEEFYLGLKTKDGFYDYPLKDHGKTWFLPSDFYAEIDSNGYWKWKVDDEWN